MQVGGGTAIGKVGRAARRGGGPDYVSSWASSEQDRWPWGTETKAGLSSRWRQPRSNTQASQEGLGQTLPGGWCSCFMTPGVAGAVPVEDARAPRCVSSFSVRCWLETLG